MGKPRYTRKYPTYPEIPENKRDTRKYPIVYFNTPTRPEPDPLPGILSNTRPDPTRYWKTLPAGHWVAPIGLISGVVVGVCVLDYSCPAELLWVYTDIVEYIWQIVDYSWPEHILLTWTYWADRIGLTPCWIVDRLVAPEI